MVIIVLMLEVIKEAHPTMAGRVWRMMPWAWEEEEEVGEEEEEVEAMP